MDIKAYRDYAQANAGRLEVMTPEHVQSVIEKLDHRLADPNFKHKHEHYRAERERLAAVLEVMTDG